MLLQVSSLSGKIPLKRITEMVRIQFTGLLLGLLVVLHAFLFLFAHAQHQGKDLNRNNQLGGVLSGENIVPTDQKVYLDSIKMRKAVIGGRKMAVSVHKVLSRREIPKDLQGLDVNAGDSKGISGKNSNALKTDQCQNPSKSEKFSQEHKSSAPKGETQRLLEASREIVNLMNKDYKGIDRPRRKPPINNHVPRH